MDVCRRSLQLHCGLTVMQKIAKCAKDEAHDAVHISFRSSFVLGVSQCVLLRRSFSFQKLNISPFAAILFLDAYLTNKT